MSTSKLPWLIAAIPLIAALHAGCGSSNNTGGDAGNGDSSTDGSNGGDVENDSSNG